MVRFLLVATLFFFSGCGLKAREEALKAHEVQLAEREEQLHLREQDLAMREMELARKVKQLDSLAMDTTMEVDSAILGTWSTKMICTETTCPGSALGDTKSEVWEFSVEEGHLLAKAKVKDKVVRVYIGQNAPAGYRLTEVVDNTSNGIPTKITIFLSVKDNKTMEGTRRIVRGDECFITYSLQLSKL